MSILVLTSDTLIGTPATGNLEYNGQFFGTDSNASRAQMQRITQGTAVASTSGTSIDFTGLPAWVKKITVMFNGVSTNSTSEIQIQIGTSGGIQTTNYLGTWLSSTAAGNATSNATSGFLVFANGGGAAFTRQGFVILALIDSANGIWSAGGTVGLSDSGRISTVGGTKSLSGVLTTVRITTVNGTDTFDAGSINLLLEG